MRANILATHPTEKSIGISYPVRSNFDYCNFSWTWIFEHKLVSGIWSFYRSFVEFRINDFGLSQWPQGFPSEAGGV